MGIVVILHFRTLCSRMIDVGHTVERILLTLLRSLLTYRYLINYGLKRKTKATLLY